MSTPPTTSPERCARYRGCEVASGLVRRGELETAPTQQKRDLVPELLPQSPESRFVNKIIISPAAICTPDSHVLIIRGNACCCNYKQQVLRGRAGSVNS